MEAEVLQELVRWQALQRTAKRANFTSNKRSLLKSSQSANLNFQIQWAHTLGLLKDQRNLRIKAPAIKKISTRIRKVLVELTHQVQLLTIRACIKIALASCMEASTTDMIHKSRYNRLQISREIITTRMMLSLIIKSSRLSSSSITIHRSKCKDSLKSMLMYR